LGWDKGSAKTKAALTVTRILIESLATVTSPTACPIVLLEKVG